MSTSFPIIPVRLPDWEELNRRVSLLSAFLIKRVPTRGILSGLVNPSYTCTAGSPSTPLTGYGIGFDSFYADADTTNGFITVKESGLYTVSAAVVFTGGANQDSYALEVIQTVAGTPIYSSIAVTEWGSKTVAASLSGTGITRLDAGDVISMGIYEASTTPTIDIQSGQLSIEQVT